MRLQVKQWLAPPIFPDDETKTRRASLLNSTLLTCLVLALCIVVGNLAGGKIPTAVNVADIIFFAVCLVLRRWVYQGRIGLAGGALLATGLVTITIAVAMLGTIRVPVTAAYILMVIAAGLLFDLNGMMVMTVLCSFAVAGLGWAENAGLLPHPDYTVTITQWVTYTALFVWVGSLTLLSRQSTLSALARAEREIVERKRAEEKLRASEEKYRGIHENAPVGIFQSNADGRFLSVNPAMARIYGYDSPADMLESVKDISTQIHAHLSSRAEFQQRLDRDGQVYEFLGENLRKDGSHIWTLTSARVVKDTAGNFLYYEGFLQDITKRKRAEEALSETNAKLTRAQRIAHIGSWSDYLPTNQLDWSKEMYRIFGFPPDTPVNLAEAIRAFPPEELARFQKALGETVNADVPYSMDYKIIRADGAVRYIHDEGEVIRDEKGQAIWMHGTTQDITERRRAEDEIRHRAIELTALLKSSQELATTLDLKVVLQTTADNITKLMELQTSAIYLLEGETLYLGATSPALPPQFPEEFRRAPLADHPRIRQSITTGVPVFLPDAATAELTPAERAVSEARGLRSTLYLPLIAGAKVVGTLIVATIGEPRVLSEVEIDLCRTLANLAALAVENAQLYESAQHHAATLELRIAERKRAEEQLQFALAEKTALVREVQHRVKNSLQAMLALMQLRRTEITDPSLQQILTQLMEQARTLSLAYEQLYQSGQLAQVEMQPYLKSLATYLVQAFSPHRNIVLHVEAGDTRLNTRWAMPCGLLVNELVTNALKHAFPPDFSETATIRIELREEQTRYILHVTDNGVGKPAPDALQKPSTLGLELINLWATHQLGGTLHVDSTQGTAYTVTFETDTKELAQWNLPES